ETSRPPGEGSDEIRNRAQHQDCESTWLGSCTRSTPVIILNSSPATCCEVPLPPEPMLILPGLALAYAMNSGTVLAGTDGWISIIWGRGVVPSRGMVSGMKFEGILS